MLSHNDSNHQKLLDLPKDWDELLTTERFVKRQFKSGFWNGLVREYVSSNPPADEKECEEMFQHFWQQLHSVLTVKPHGVAHAVVSNYDVYLKNWLQTISTQERKKIVNEQQQYSDAPLHAAVERKNLAMVKILVDAGAGINAKGSMQETPLHRAIGVGDIVTAKYLIDLGADLNLSRMDSLCAIHVAIVSGQPDIVSLILDKDPAQIECRGRSGRSPLFHAVVQGDTAIVERLVASGARINAISNLDGYAPLHYAAMNNKPDMVNCLIKCGATVDLPDRVGFTPLQRCALQDAPAVAAAKVLLDYEANPDAGDKPAIYLLAAEASQRSPHTLEMARMLVDKGADTAVQVDGNNAYDILKKLKAKKILKKDEEGLLNFLDKQPKASSTAKKTSLFSWVRKK